jgi:amino acid transporter
MEYWASQCSSASGLCSGDQAIPRGTDFRDSFCIENIQDLVEADSDFPIIDVLARTTGSKGATIVLGSLLIVLLFFSTVTTTASASRQIWAFSRDQVRAAGLAKIIS